jgi:hypothetical protein
MTLSIPTFTRPSSLLTAVLAGTIAVGIVAIGASAQGLEPEPPTARTEIAIRVPAPQVDGAAIMARLDSEYLREIAADWYTVAPSTVPGQGPGLWNAVILEFGPAVDPSLLHSELLREIAAEW